jgi:hypothetical protein
MKGSACHCGGGRDDYGVEPWGFQQVLVKFEGLRALALEFFDFRRALGELLTIHITEGADLNTTHLEGGFYVHHAIPAAADETEF